MALWVGGQGCSGAFGRGNAHRAVDVPALLLMLALTACQFDRGDRWDKRPAPATVTPPCAAGQMRCTARGLEQCDAKDRDFTVIDDCASKGQVCATSLLRCSACQPGQAVCQGKVSLSCDPTGATLVPIETCDSEAGIACRDGRCRDLCAAAAVTRSNVGCEYWGVDLDNARISESLNAAAQQFAVVLSNPQPDIAARVTIEQDDSLPGEAPRIRQVAAGSISPMSLQVFKLGPREVDGSPEGEFNTGTGTALTRHGYRVRSGVPIVAYQFNPLENANVFSNDASLLKPVEALVVTPGTLAPAYVALGWPQTIASTDDPNTNFGSTMAEDLRAFLTVVGTRAETHVRVTTRARVIAGGPVQTTEAGGTITAILQPFDVLNLETGAFNADFTGSLVDADQPIAVFSGSEASDAPTFQTLATRSCCADHLEEQLDPIRTAGRNFVLAHTASRTKAIAAAGALVGIIDEPEYFRVLAVAETGAHVTTSFPPPDDHFVLAKKGDFREITALHDGVLTADAPVFVGDVQASQEAAGIAHNLPGGDPSLVVLPPIEQFRPTYVFLTPDKYAFDFVTIIAPADATVLLDQQKVDGASCEMGSSGSLPKEASSVLTSPQTVYRCQLSFPRIDPSKSSPDNVTSGKQNDGVHTIESDRNVGVLVFGFDSYVSYAYAGGTQLEEINVQ